jgi:hypothetical protein
MHDSGYLRDQFTLFPTPGNADHAARRADLQLTARESLPGGLQAVRRDLAELEAATARRPGQLFAQPIRIAPRAARLSDVPLPDGSARPSAAGLASQILSELADRGVSLAQVPGLEALRQLLTMRPAIPPEDLAEVQVRYRVQLKQLRQLGFTDAARNAKALIDADGNVGLALMSLDG